MGTLCDFLSVICPAKHIFKLRNLTQDVRQVLVCRRKESAVEWTRVLLCWQKHKRHLTITLITTLSSVGLRLTLKILSKMVQICRLIWDLNCGLRSMLQVLHHKTGLTSGPAQIVVGPPLKKALFSFIRLAPGEKFVSEWRGEQWTSSHAAKAWCGSAQRTGLLSSSVVCATVFYILLSVCGMIINILFCRSAQKNPQQREIH